MEKLFQGVLPSVSIMKTGAVVEEESGNVVVFRESAIAECSGDVCYQFSSDHKVLIRV